MCFYSAAILKLEQRSLRAPGLRFYRAMKTLRMQNICLYECSPRNVPQARGNEIIFHGKMSLECICLQKSLRFFLPPFILFLFMSVFKTSFSTVKNS